ncbi:polysaccharide deacetylase family sporulation protein PdaB [Alicyclobacillus fastidiosus]|uniref:Polysaccharide deacetylase family sporulation protein PdaB n=1 Tax=Alicyclobacillus fastidiosus TaxID=392011 RepID=A0ABV5AIZ5_9BACL|nr:polysaccharide deacetylase family sporulation protein PdaB [Alicyclobacillus fastidiosus]WEH10029.1 polysaccharide deacetylase family sporulation protein PdaB [Alicyclobacillus fastidiosus]
MPRFTRSLLFSLCTAIVTAGSLFVAGPSTAHAKTETPKAIYKVDTKQKVVALTFDISWGNKVPEPVLDVLKKEKVTKATFFLSGPWTLRHPEIAKQIKNMGFEIGNHGNLHKDFSNYPDSWIREQVAISEKSIQQVTGVKTKLIRTPNGDFNPRVIRCLNNMGYTVIQWNTDSLDWMNPGTQNIIQRVTKRAVPGDIILMHASDSSKQIVDALPQVITQLRKDGYQFVTVSELLSGAKVSSTTVH